MKKMLLALSILAIAVSGVNAEGNYFKSWGDNLVRQAKALKKVVLGDGAQKEDRATVCQPAPLPMQKIEEEPVVTQEELFVEQEMSPDASSVDTPLIRDTKPKIKFPFKWVVVGGNPFNDRSYETGLRMAGVSREVIEKLKVLVESSDYETGIIRNGDKILFMLSGNYEIIGAPGIKYRGNEYAGVVAAFRDRTFLTCQIYYVEDNGVLRRFARPDVCFNWCELTPVPIPPKVETPPDTTSYWQPSAPPTVNDSVPPTEESFPYTPPAPSLPYDGPKVFLRLDVWGSHDMPTYGMFTRYGANSFGVKGDILWRINQHFMLGATGMVVEWDGESETGFFYNGFQACAGPLALISFNQYVHWGLDVTSGGEWDWGWGTKDWKYRSFQSGVPLRLGSTLDIVAKKVHFSSWGGYKFSFAEAKESSLDGEPIDTRDDPALDKTGADGGMRLYFLADKKVNPLIVWRESWARFDQCVSSSIGIGIRFWDRHAVAELAYKNRDRSTMDNNGHAIEALLNLSWGFGRGRPKIEVEDQTAKSSALNAEPWPDSSDSDTTKAGGDYGEEEALW
jgi:hypothetical protein